jgi:DNA-binding beta-propeller fold protein YncE
MKAMDEQSLPLVNPVSRPARRSRKFRRRACAVAGASVTAVLMMGVVPALGAGHAGEAGTAYVATDANGVVPISLATNTPGSPIKVPAGGIDTPFETSAAAAPNGRTIYELSYEGTTYVVIPINTATNKAGRPIKLTGVLPNAIAVDPDGKTVYVATDYGVLPISAATSRVGKLIGVKGWGWWQMAFTPDGRFLYVLSHGRPTVEAIRTSTNRLVKLISLPDKDRGFPFNIAVAPNGRTVYVVFGVQEGKADSNHVVPIRVATNTPLTPITIKPHGQADGLVIAPNGTAYVLSSRAITPIDTSTNRAEPYFWLPKSAGYAYYILGSPSGRTLYVFTPRGVVPIETATEKALPLIVVPHMAGFANVAITPDGSTIYVAAAIIKNQKAVAGGVVPISTATRKAGALIKVGLVSAITCVP